MTSRYDEIVADAMKLPLKNQVRLGHQLVASLDDEVETDFETLWFAEPE